MKAFINDLLSNQGGNYILPFFWQHGETEAVLREYMRVIDECGIKAVCVEARPHSDYVGPKWWEDMDIIMDEARNREMKVWILDDAHFPTGYAAGQLTEADPALCKQYLALNRTEICGPVPEATLDIGAMSTYKENIFAPKSIFAMHGPKDRIFDNDELFAVAASKLVMDDTVDERLVDLTNRVKDGILEWDVPEGMWRIFVIYKTQNGGGRTDYINMLDEASCRVQIDAVYEPHFEHYKDDFGKTLAGFFSDEPAVGNTKGFDFDEVIGKKLMPLPWNKDMPGMMEACLGADYRRKLVALWTDTEDQDFAAKVRYSYMDAATALIAKNFSCQIGEWCAEHNVEYIGHVVEDNNQHARFGSSLGHYFRSMDGQHMSGIDDIGGQVTLGGENHNRIASFVKSGDGEFYHFTLGKLGSSFAHIDPKKQGRAMCEIYGAYGWNTGVRAMKYMTDHFLVRGINQYVPHAFSPKAFPDPDCPPHFYAHGENPQYRHFGKLMHYLNRMCHLLNGGLHVAQAAMLYQGEAEWTGELMYNQKPARELLEHQIDFDIVPSDVFADMKAFNASFDGQLKINGETYQTFIVPYSQYVTKAVAEFAAQASQAGFPAIFVDKLPEGICDAAGEAEAAGLVKALAGCKVVCLKELAAELRSNGIYEVASSTAFKRLRYYHYVKDNADLYMFSNEDPSVVYEGEISVAAKGNCYAYDAMENRLYAIDSRETAEGTSLKLRLEGYESIVVIFDTAVDNLPEKLLPCGQPVALNGPWQVSVAESKEYPNFKPLGEMDRLQSIGKTRPDFSGFIRYNKTFTCNTDSQTALLTIDNAYEGVEVWVNGQNGGMRICPPYRFDLSGLVKAGENDLRIEVATTLYRKVDAMDKAPNPFSAGTIVVEPTGIVGDVKIYI